MMWCFIPINICWTCHVSHPSTYAGHVMFSTHQHMLDMSCFPPINICWTCHVSHPSTYAGYVMFFIHGLCIPTMSCFLPIDTYGPCHVLQLWMLCFPPIYCVCQPCHILHLFTIYASHVMFSIYLLCMPAMSCFPSIYYVCQPCHVFHLLTMYASHFVFSIYLLCMPAMSCFPSIYYVCQPCRVFHLFTMYAGHVVFSTYLLCMLAMSCFPSIYYMPVMSCFAIIDLLSNRSLLNEVLTFKCFHSEICADYSVHNMRKELDYYLPLKIYTHWCAHLGDLGRSCALGMFVSSLLT